MLNKISWVAFTGFQQAVKLYFLNLKLNNGWEKIYQDM